MVFIRVNKKYDNYQEVLIIPVGGFPFFLPFFHPVQNRSNKTHHSRVGFKYILFIFFCPFFSIENPKIDKRNPFDKNLTTGKKSINAGLFWSVEGSSKLGYKQKGKELNETYPNSG